MTSKEIEQLNAKIKKGLALSFHRLVEKTKKEDGELIFSENGKSFAKKPAILNNPHPFFDSNTGFISTFTHRHWLIKF